MSTFSGLFFVIKGENIYC